MKLQTKILIGVIAFLAIGFLTFGYLWKQEKNERVRQETNVEQLTSSVDQSNMELNLTRDEFSKMKTEWANRYDSIIKAKDWKINQITEVYTMEIAYRDSIDKMAKMGTPIPIKQKETKGSSPSKVFQKTMVKIPFEQTDSCMYIFGNVITSDPFAKVQITDKGFVSIGDLFGKRKRVLGFLWWKKPYEYVTVAKCGEMKYKHIIFTK